MITESKGAVRNTIELGAFLALGAAGGLFVAWLKTSFGFSPYWFVGSGTALAIATTAWIVWSVTRPCKPVFVFDWVMGVEGVMGLLILSVSGLVALAALVWNGTVLVLVSVALLGLLFTILAYVINHPPPTTWDDEADL